MSCTIFVQKTIKMIPTRPESEELRRRRRRRRRKQLIRDCLQTNKINK